MFVLQPSSQSDPHWPYPITDELKDIFHLIYIVFFYSSG